MSDVQQCDVQSKPWGKTRHIGSDIYHASIKAGGYSSQHRHNVGHNDFYIVSGKLLIHFYRQKGDVSPYSTALMQPGMRVTAKRGEWHRFEAVTDVELIEWYYADQYHHSDIERYDVGGLDEYKIRPTVRGDAS